MGNIKDSETPVDEGFLKRSRVVLGKAAGILTRQTLAVAGRVGSVPSVIREKTAGTAC